MKLDRVPPRILVALGLGSAVMAEEGCVSSCLDVASETGSVDACLSPPIEPSESASASATSGADTVGSESGLPPGDSTSVGPCLGQQATDTGTGSGSGSSSGSGSDTGTGSSSDSDSGSDSGLPAPDDGDAVIDRVLSSGALPSDVSARLRDRRR